jgi:hypothetical protein
MDLSDSPMHRGLHTYDWNYIYAKYCDGFSFSGNASIHNCTHSDGYAIHLAVMALVPRATTTHIVVSGGFAVYVHCDTWVDAFPAADVSCISENGYLPHKYRSVVQHAATLHNSVLYPNTVMPYDMLRAMIHPDRMLIIQSLDDDTWDDPDQGIGPNTNLLLLLSARNIAAYIKVRLASDGGHRMLILHGYSNTISTTTPPTTTTSNLETAAAADRQHPLGPDTPIVLT